MSVSNGRELLQNIIQGIQSYSDEIINLNGRIVTLEEQTVSLNSKIAALNTEKSSLEAANASLIERNLVLEGNKEAVENQLHAVIEERNALAAQIDGLKQERDAAASALGEANNHVSKLTVQNTQLATQVAALQSSLKTVQGEKDTLVTERDALLVEQVKLLAEIERLKNTIPNPDPEPEPEPVKKYLDKPVFANGKIKGFRGGTIVDNNAAPTARRDTNLTAQVNFWAQHVPTVNALAIFLNYPELQKSPIPALMLDKKLTWYADTMFAIYTQAYNSKKPVTEADKQAAEDYAVGIMGEYAALAVQKGAEGFIFDDTFNHDKQLPLLDRLIGAIRAKAPGKPVIATVGALYNNKELLDKFDIVQRQFYRQGESVNLWDTWLTNGLRTDMINSEAYKAGSLTTAQEYRDMLAIAMKHNKPEILVYAFIDSTVDLRNQTALREAVLATFSKIREDFHSYTD